MATYAHLHVTANSLVIVLFKFLPPSGSTEAPLSPLLSAPTIGELNQLVVWRVAAQWYEVGVLLGVGAAVLDSIRADNFYNVRQACRSMFSEWLARRPGTGEQPRVWLSVLETIKEAVGEKVAEEVEKHFNSSPKQIHH